MTRFERSIGGLLVIETSDAALDEAYAAAHHGVIPGHYVMIAVTDTGCGMSPATIEHIFEPFYTPRSRVVAPASVSLPHKAS